MMRVPRLHSLRVLPALAILTLQACGGGGGSAPPAEPPVPPPPSAQTTVEGAAQKGPFIVGSTVRINLLNAAGQPTSRTILTETKDNIGTFSFSIDEPGLVQIVADGYYYSELSGNPSEGTITLKALHEVRSGNDRAAYVNLMTHLINDRALALFSNEGLTMQAALRRAEAELIAAFADALPLEETDAAITNFSTLNLYNSDRSAGFDLGNAYLLALSSAFYKYAEQRAEEFASTTDAELSLLLNELSDDLADDGEIARPGFIEAFVRALRSLDVREIRENLAARSLFDYPEALDVPDISRFLHLCAGNFECPWRAGSPMEQPIGRQAATTHDGKIYTFGGDTGKETEDHRHAYEYDPESNEWRKLTPMPVGLYVLEAHSIGGQIFVIGGYGSCPMYDYACDEPPGFSNHVLVYDPLRDRWQQGTPRPTYRYLFASAAVDGKIYVIGGVGIVDDGPWRSGAPWESKDHVEVYDPTTDTWDSLPPAPRAFASSAACALEGKIYIFGESGSEGRRPSVNVYEPATGAWSTRTPMPVYRERAQCVQSDGLMYLVGDEVGGAVDRYGPERDAWDTPTRLPTPRDDVAASQLDGQVYVFGGLDEGSPHTEVLDRLTDVTEVLDTSSPEIRSDGT